MAKKWTAKRMAAFLLVDALHGGLDGVGEKDWIWGHRVEPNPRTLEDVHHQMVKMSDGFIERLQRITEGTDLDDASAFFARGQRQDDWGDE